MSAFKWFLIGGDFDFSAGADLPSFNAGYDEESSTDIMGIPRKKLIMLTVVGIIALVALYFAADYFIFSIKEVDIEVVNLDKKPLTASVDVLDSQNNKILSLSGESSYTFSLRREEYDLKIFRTGYKSNVISLASSDFSGENISKEIELEKDLGILIETVDIDSTTFAGQSLTGSIQVKNNSSSEQTFEIKASKLTDANLTLDLEEMTLAAGKGKNISFTVNINSDLDVPKKGKPIKGSISIGLTKVEKPFEIMVIQPPKLDSDSSVKFSKIDLASSHSLTKSFKIENTADVSAPGITASIELEPSANVDAIDWISFSDSGTNTLSFDLDKKEKKTISLDLLIPMSAVKETIEGKIIFNADFLDNPVETALTIQISKEAEVGLDISLEPNDTAEVPFDEDTGFFDEVTDYYLLIANSGSVEINNIVINLSNQSDCSDDYFGFKGDTLISSVLPTEEKRLNFSITMPPSEKDAGNTITCNLSVTYKHDLLGDERVVLPFVLSILQEE